MTDAVAEKQSECIHDCLDEAHGHEHRAGKSVDRERWESWLVLDGWLHEGKERVLVSIFLC
jgi:hypothetical protein